MTLKDIERECGPAVAMQVALQCEAVGAVFQRDFGSLPQFAQLDHVTQEGMRRAYCAGWAECLHVMEKAAPSAGGGE